MSGDVGGSREVFKVWETGGSGWTGILGSEGAFVKQVFGRISEEQECAGRCCGV